MMPAGCARVLAAAMGVGAAGGGPLTELEMSAIGEASNQMLASAAAAISVVIGQEIEISPPDVRIIDGKHRRRLMPGAPPRTRARRRSRSPASRAAWCSSCRARSSCAWRERSTRSDGADRGRLRLRLRRRRRRIRTSACRSPRSSSDINLRVWAELGRTQLPIGKPRSSFRSARCSTSTDRGRARGPVHQRALFRSRATCS